MSSSAVPSGSVIETPGPAQRPSPTRTLALALATAGGVGLAPIAPGTAGAAAGVLVFLALASLSLALFVLTVTTLTILGVWAADTAERAFQRRDDGRIVIDEVAGQLVTLAPLTVLGGTHSPLWLVTGFVLFRVFDVWKPGPVRWAEEHIQGGAGVMLDDVLAGVLAALVLALLVAFAGGTASEAGAA